LGLAQYAPAFRDNDVDAEVLPMLTADDLIGLGVTSIGHRRKLLAAIIQKFGSGPVGVAALAAVLSGRYVPGPGERVAVVLSGANTTAVDFSR
jgi:threonine dehydratase